MKFKALILKLDPQNEFFTKYGEKMQFPSKLIQISLILKLQVLEISNFLYVVINNMAHCIIKLWKYRKHTFLIYAVCIDPKIAQIVPKSVFLAQQTVFLAQN